MSRVGELEQLLMSNLQLSSPEWTGNLRRHITAFGDSHIRISGPAYNADVARGLVNKFGKGMVRRLSYSEKVPFIEKKGYTRERYSITIRNTGKGTKELFDYAWLLNEFGSWGSRNHNMHWVDRAIYNTCAAYAFANNGEVRTSKNFLKRI